MKNLSSLLIAFLLFQFVSVAQQGWFWQNPLPQGNLLYDIETLYGLTVAVGSNGTILTSSGSPWLLRESGTDKYLFSVSMRGVHAWVSGSEGTMLHSSDGVGYLWEEQTTGITNKQLRSVFFLNENYGWSVGEQETIIKTTNGGANWQVLNSSGSQHYFGIYFHDENNGWLCGAAGSNGVIKRTTNGGSLWLNSIIPASRMNAIHFADTSFGCAVGDGGAVFRTTNGGTNWSLVSSGTTKDLKSVYLKSPVEGWAVGYDGTIIYTSDQGSSWISQTSGTYDHLYSVYNGWAAGNAGTILRTTNGGILWGKQSNGFTNWITEVDFVTSSVGYASGWGGKVYRTLDGGGSWQELSVGSSLDLYAIDFKKYDDITGVGYTVGRANGNKFTVYRTYNHGASWLDKSFTIPNVSIATHLYNCYKMLGRTYVVGRFGLIARTDDGGSTWAIQKTNSQSYDLWTIDFESEYVGWAAGSSGTVLKTTNKGNDWFEVNPDNVSNFRSIYFADIKHGWVVGVGGVIYRTTDGGYNWTKTTPNVTYERLNSVYFADLNNGWICGANGTILHTTDGGLNWYFQESGTDNELTSLSFTETGVGWIGGNSGTILHTEDGGGFVNVQTFWKNILNLSLADPGEATDDMNVIIDTKLLNAFSLSGVSVVLDTVIHTNVTDLTFLLSHNGVTDTLVGQPVNAGSDFIGCTLSDAASVPVELAYPPFTGIFKPRSPLSAFYGMDPNGIWTLKIIDRISGNTGTLEAWGLRLYFDAPTSYKSELIPAPEEFRLYQNYPNPFNPSTKIKYSVPELSDIVIKIFDVLGNEIETLVNQEKPAGTYEVAWNAVNLTSGVYFCQLRAGSFVECRKMIFLK